VSENVHPKKFNWKTCAPKERSPSWMLSFSIAS